MAIDIQTIEQVKTVSKPWGKEKWIQPGGDQYPFVLKELTLLDGQRTSLQVHQFKSESIIILSGTGSLLHHMDTFDCKRYLDGGYGEEEILDIIDELQLTKLKPGMVFHTPPGTIHRMIAKTKLIYMEASTTELVDVIRLHDDKQRQHGRIDSEHK